MKTPRQKTPPGINLRQGDALLIQAFFKSLIWERARGEERFKHKRGLQDALRDYLRQDFRIPERVKTPIDIELAVGRIGKHIRSTWAQRAAKTRARKKELRKKAALKRLQRLIWKIERAEKKRKAAKRRDMRPTLFGEMPVQYRPSKKPQGEVV